jgi:hypothetical protein
MTRQYIYKPSDAGLDRWPEGELRFPSIDVTEDPAQADLFTVPGPLTPLFPTREDLYRLPHFRGREDKHTLFDCSDNEPLYDLPCLFIRCNTRSWYLTRDENTISWPWPVEDFADCMPVLDGGFTYDVSFHGWITSHDSRKLSYESVQRSELRVDLAGYLDFYGYIEKTAEGMRRRAEYRRSLQESRLALCPESIAGVFPYRFFEAMSAARMPVLVGEEFVFPFVAEINYQDFMIHIARADASKVGAILTEYLRTHPDDELIERGKLARKAYETWLHRDRWPELLSYAVQKKLGVLV